MNETSSNSIDPRIEAALQEYLQRLDRGEAVEREAFLARYPEIADALLNFIAAEEELRKLAGDKASRESGGSPAQTIAPDAQETVPPKSRRDRSPAAAAGELQRRFGRYRIIRTLGSGAMGTVHLALDTQLGRQVAIKTPSFDDDPTGELVARFYREARAAATLRHANICPVYDVGQIEGKHYISMAYIEGYPLSALIRPDKPQAERQILIVVHQLALALKQAHDHGIVHRDLKPANILIDKRGEPIIMDFGLARKTSPDGGDASLTRSGMVLGSPAYMSPEQVEGDPHKVGAPSDQYSLGVIFYEMLAGRSPFQGTVLSVLAQIVTKEIAPPRRWRTDLDPRIEAVCLRMIAKDPAERFQSLKVVADELVTILKTPRKAAASSESSRRTSASQVLKSVEKEATESDLLSIEELAAKCLARHDYDQVIQILERIPDDRRKAGAQTLLDEARAKNARIVALVGEIDAADRLRDARTVLKNADELLKIKPGHHRAKEIQAKYSSRSGWRALRTGPLRHFTKPWNEGGWIPWSALAFGLVVFAAMSGAMFFYLRGTVVVVQVTDPDVEVSVQGSTLTITGPGRKEVKVEPGNQELMVQYGDLHFASKSFSINRGEKKTVTVTIIGEDVVLTLDGENFVLEPKEKAGKVGPASGKPGLARSGTEKSANKSVRADSSTSSRGRTLVAPFDSATAKKGQKDCSDRLKVPPQSTNVIGMKLVLIPPGEFMMGLAASQIEPSRALMRSPNVSEAQKKGILDAEQPQHRVRITRAFYIGQYEVTRGQFASFVKAEKYKTEAARIGATSGSKQAASSRPKPNSDGEQDDSHPVQVVSWNDATAFCRWLSREEGKTYRLPTEAEWEYACRAGTETLFYFGNDPAELARFENTADAISLAAGRASLKPVGQFRPNPFGLYDMLGNAREWCQDWFTDDYYGKSRADDPPGPTAGTLRAPQSWQFELARQWWLSGGVGLPKNVKGPLHVVRGGGSNSSLGPADYRSSIRGCLTPVFATPGVGFRVVCEIGAEKADHSAGKELVRSQKTQAAPQLPPQVQPPVDPDRRAAEWALSKGGFVNVFQYGKLQEIGPGGELPKNRFELRRLNVASKSIDNSQLVNLEGLAHLKFLNLHENPVSEAGIAHIKGLSTLVDLDLSQTKVTDAGLEHLSDLTHLQTLHLWGNSQLTEAGLEHLQSLPNLNRLYLWWDHGVTDRGLEQLADMVSLTDLDLNGTQVTDAGLIHLEGLTNLRYLNLMSTHISGAGFVHLKSLPNLTSFDLAYSTVGDAGMTQVDELANLTNLRLDHTRVTDAGLARLNHLKQLQLLQLRETAITDAGLVHLRGLDNLDDLELDQTQVSGSGLENLKPLARLRTLSLSRTPVTDAALVHLKTLVQLDRVRLQGTAVTDAGLAILRDMKYLTEIDLTATKVTPPGVERLRRVLPGCRVISSFPEAPVKGVDPNPERKAAQAVLKHGGSVTIRVNGKEQTLQRGQRLPGDAFQILRFRMSRHLSDVECKPLRQLTNPFDVILAQIKDADIPHLKGMTGIYNLELPGTPISNSGLAPLKGLGLTHLRHLNLAGTRLTDVGMAHLAPLVRLEGISLADTRITDKGLRHLEPLKSLGDLWLWNTHITDAGMAHLEGLTALTALGLGGTRVTDAGLEHLARLRRLDFLELGNTGVTGSGLSHLSALTRLRHLALNRSQLTDQNLVHLKNFPRLERLELQSVGVTDAGLEHLKDLVTLRELDLSGTQLTAAGVEKLRKALPACRIVMNPKPR